ncbi:DUF5753 domain-containing protein [Streptomyces sp. NPDC006971]|uniref:DUF5753 domain-containing protein n=1 Tax=Streptomyces sp. NPDC006971 TaxID=3154784 RepID=UPI0033D442E6
MAGVTPARAPGGKGTIDVRPSHLWSVSGRVASQQESLVRGANSLLRELGKYPDAGGAGTEAQRFAQAYKKIGNRWLEVWGRSVLSIGGVAVGFTETANAYTRADAATHPKGKTAEQRPRPAVIDKAPNFGSVPDIKWGDFDGGDDFERGMMEGIPEIVRDVLQPLCKYVFRVGRVADVHPFPQQHYLNSLCHSWMNVSVVATMAADQLSQAVGTITNHQQADWEAAMRTFCSALWGGTAWGQQRQGYQWAQTANSGPGTPRLPTGSEPVLAVLKDTADNIATILREYAEAAVDLNRDVADERERAMREAAKEIIEDLAKPKSPNSILTAVTSAIGGGTGLLLSFDVKTVLNFDTARLNRIVDTYTIERGRRMPDDDFVERAEAALGNTGALRKAAPHLSLQAGLASWFRQWARWEKQAVALWTYECRVIPGLLQTERYARAVTQSVPPVKDEEQVAKQVAARQERQHLFDRRPPISFSFIMEQALIERGTGGPEVMREMLDHLLECSSQFNVELQIMPRYQPDHAGFDGPLMLLERQDHKWCGYAEGQRSGFLITDPKEVSITLQRYAKLRSQAPTPEDSRSLLRQVRGAL